MTPADKSSASEPTPLGQYVPLFSWAIVVVLLLLIPLKIIGYGFLPGGDARRHVAKAFTAKPYTDILVLRSEYKMDHSPGWARLLRFLQGNAGLSEEQFVGFFLAGWWRAGFWLTACWAAGTFAGALLTGRPFTFLKQAIDIAAVISREHVPQWLLVGEFMPSYGEFATVALVAVVLLWRAVQGKPGPGPFSQPVFWLLVICWICGFKADRWWADWGVPAVLVWLTFQFEELMAAAPGAESLTRRLPGGRMAGSLFPQSASGHQRDYSPHGND